jgi:hypothetical protein
MHFQKVLLVRDKSRAGCAFLEGASLGRGSLEQWCARRAYNFQGGSAIRVLAAQRHE